MSEMTTVITVSIIAAIFTALLTYFITTLTSRGYTKNAITEGFKTHVGMYHKTDYGVMIESAELKLETSFEKAIKPNTDSIASAHQRIDETNKSVSGIAVDIAEIKTGLRFISDYIKGGKNSGS